MSIISTPLGYVIRWCYEFTENILNFGGYALALFLFSLIMQIVLFPLGIKQQKNSQKQASLRPKEAAIRKKYAGRNDKATQQKVQQEIYDLYQEEHFSPFSGCLPMLIQLPIIFALYDVVRKPLTYISRFTEEAVQRINAIINGDAVSNYIDEIRLINSEKFSDALAQVHTEGLIESAEPLIPDFSFFGDFIDLSAVPSTIFEGASIWLVLIPVLTFVAQYFGTMLTRKFTYTPQAGAETAGSMKIMNVVMPLFSLYLAFTFPAALGLYWIYRSILAFVQQFLLSRMYKIPVITEEEMKAAEKQYNEKKKHVKLPEPDRRRSLIYGYDDDTQDEGETKDKAIQAIENKDSIIPQAPLKDDEKK